MTVHNHMQLSQMLEAKNELSSVVEEEEGVAEKTHLAACDAYKSRGVTAPVLGCHMQLRFVLSFPCCLWWHLC